MAGTILKALNKFETENSKAKERIQESLDVLNTLIGSSPDMTLNTRGFIEAKVDLLRGELDGTELEDEDIKIEAAIEKFQKAMAREASIADLRTGVKAFYKKGLYAEALDNLRCLIQKNAADEFCVIAVMGCMLHLHTKQQLATAVDRFIADAFQDDERGALFKSMLAKKMTKKGYAQHAKILTES